MPISFELTTQPADQVKADLLVVPVFTDAAPGPGADIVDAALGGGLAAFMGEAGYSGKPGETLAIPTSGRLAAKAAVLVGVGDTDEITLARLRRAGASLARRASKVATVATTLPAVAPSTLEPADVAQAIAEGAALGSYQFLEYKTEGTPSKLRRVILVGVGGADVSAALQRARIVTDAVMWARDIVNEPSGAKSPAEFAAAALRLLTGAGLTVTVLAEAQIKAHRMGAVIGVAQGSASPPRFVKVVYTPRSNGKARPAGTLALVGKGVTFDSGGISIKPAEGMETMKTDMGGAAAVLGAMSTLRALDVRHRVIAYVPMVENMPSGTAIRPGDVLRARNGKTIEVLNTDAEGRLILADALALAVDDGVDAIVDLATLTGACVVALGEKVAGLMGNDGGWVDQVRSAADQVGEAVWPLPLPEDYRKLLDSEVADLRNIGANRYGGALTAGLFLEAFVADVPWAHLDIAGPARAPADDGEFTKGATGFGVRLLAELARTFEAPAGTATKKPAKATKKTTKKTTKKAAKKATKKTTKTRATKKRKSPGR